MRMRVFDAVGPRVYRGFHPGGRFSTFRYRAVFGVAGLLLLAPLPAWLSFVAPIKAQDWGVGHLYDFVTVLLIGGSALCLWRAVRGPTRNPPLVARREVTLSESPVRPWLHVLGVIS